MATLPAAPTPPAGTPRRPVVVAPVVQRPGSGNVVWALIAAVVSVAAHAILLLLLLNISMASAGDDVPDDSPIQSEISDPVKDEYDLTYPDLGTNTNES